MRVMPRGVEPINDRERQVIDVELDQRGLQVGGLVETLGERVRLELESPPDPGHDKRDELVVGLEEKLQNDDQAHEDGPLLVEIERSVEDLAVDEHGEDEEIEERVDLAEDQVLDVVIELPVAELVGQNGQDLVCAAAFAFLALLVLVRVAC